jgi:hypothetical protein
LARFVCVNCSLSTNLSSFLLPRCRLLLLLCCRLYVVCFAAWSIVLLVTLTQQDANIKNKKWIVSDHFIWYFSLGAKYMKIIGHNSTLRHMGGSSSMFQPENNITNRIWRAYRNRIRLFRKVFFAVLLLCFDVCLLQKKICCCKAYHTR